MPGDDRTLRVAFPAGEWLDWVGGLNYHRNLLRAIADDPHSRLEPMLFLGRSGDEDRLAGFPRVPLVRSRMLDRRSVGWAIRAMSRRGFDRDPLLERKLTSHGVRAVSHSSRVWPSSRLAMLGWIPDFQHRRLPEFFSEPERSQREDGFARIVRASTIVIVSSESSRRDLLEFDSDAAARSRVLRFVAEPPAAEALPTSRELIRRYGFDGPYFHVPNQFWAHKNHAVLIEALGLLRESGTAVPVVATGATDDYRRPEHFESLLARARELGVDDLFLTLGVVPYTDAMALMRDATAVINPSLCEGWATSVEESRSLGKQVLVSDIDVHREQDPPGASFFDPHAPDELAAAMQRALTADPAETARLASDARESLEARRLAFARTYERIVADAVESGP